MAIKKIFLMLFVLLSCVSSIFGLVVPQNSLVDSYYKLDIDSTTQEDSTGKYNATTVSSTYTALGKIGGAYDFDGSTSYIDLEHLNQQTYNFSISLWVNIDSFTNNHVIIADANSDGSEGVILWLQGSTIRFQFNGVAGEANTNTLNTDTWYHIVATYDGTTSKIYSNANHTGNFTAAPIYSSPGDWTLGRLGEFTSSAFYFDGKIDEVAIFDYVIDQDEVDYLFNSNYPGSDQQYVFPSGSSVITTDSKDYYNFTNININWNSTGNINLSYSLNNDSFVAICTYCNSSSFNLIGVEGINTIDFKLIELSGISWYNTSFIIDTVVPQINISNTYDIYSYDVNMSELFNYSDTNYNNCTINNNISCEGEYTFPTIGEKNLTILVSDLAGNSATLNKTIRINPLQTFKFLDESSSYINDFYINNIFYSDELSFPIYDIGLGLHEFEFSKSGYNTTSFFREFNTTSNYNQNISMPFAKLTIKIYDRDTKVLIDEVTYIEVIGSHSYSTNVTNGEKTIQDLEFIDEDYVILAINDNYFTETVFFHYSNQDHLTVNIYMIEKTASDIGSISLTVEDDIGYPKKNMLVKLLEWSTDESSFIPVSEKRTGFTLGDAYFSIIKFNKLYKLCAYPENQEPVCLQEGTIQKDNEEFFITVLDQHEKPELLENYTGNITHITSYPNVEFTFNFIDPDNLVNEFCMSIYSEKGMTRTFLIENCLEASSGEITINIDNPNNLSLYAESYATTDIQYKKIDELYVTFESTFQDQVEEGNLTEFLVLVILGGFIAFGMLSGKIKTVLFILTLFPWVIVKIFPSVFSVSIAFVIDTILILAIWAVKSKGGNT